jgi:glycosyltransferase involved in cell wall biosynthesis
MSAARRASGLTKYLGLLGHRVTVLTSVMSGSGPIPEAARTVRTRDLLVSPLNWRRSGLAALQGDTTVTVAAAPSALAAWTVPDLQLAGWVPFALARAVGLARRERFDCVITTSPPASAHLIGLALRRSGVAWVADFRDGWTFETQRPAWAHPWLGTLDRALERFTVRRADGVSAVTAPIGDDLGRRFGRQVTTITNGFDPDAVPAPSPAGNGLLSGHRRSLVHTGTLSYGGRSIEPLLEAFTILRRTSPDAAESLEIALVGPVTDAERQAVKRAGMCDAFSLPGSLPHDQTLAIQRAADGLLVITGPGQTGVATGKLYEYMAAKRPILVIGDDTAAAEIVERARAGIAVARDDPHALAGALQRFAERLDELPRPTPTAVQQFAYPALAAQMAELVEQALTRRAAARGVPSTAAGR